MSNLDGFHPFRQSVNVRDSSVASPASVPEASHKENEEKEDKEFTPWFSWNTKFRVLIFALAGSFLMLVISNAYESLSSGISGKTPNRFTSNKKESPVEAPVVVEVFDKNDLNERGREVSHARRKAGFFASIFCKGGKRSSFCAD